MVQESFYKNVPVRLLGNMGTILPMVT